MDPKYENDLISITISRKKLSELQYLIDEMQFHLGKIIEDKKFEPVLKQFSDLEWQVQEYNNLKSMKAKAESFAQFLKR
ncbi:hypothetical protein K9M74_01175 [Candidatus Woesearchaeota archaeon]|jgi:hypothetical protein|nr:hypothetical protein [Candidatus Woesearchaeota archaeon]